MPQLRSILIASIASGTLTLPLLSGCTGSRWAREDPAYASKYKHHSDNIFQSAKQAIDARFVEGRAGGRIGAEFGSSPATAGASVAAFGFPKSWFEVYGGLHGIAGTGDESLFGGLGAGARIHSPSRLSVFSGLGGQIVGGEQDLSGDNLDNDRDFLIDEPDEEEINQYYAAILPELGIHFWLTPTKRLTASARYSISTSGRDDDQWLFGFSISCLPKPETDWEDLDCDELKSGYFIADRANQDLSDIHADVSAKYDRQVADRVIDMIYDDFDLLAADPNRGAKLTDDLRQLVTHGGPVIEYTKVGRGIEITSLHSQESRSQDPRSTAPR